MVKVDIVSGFLGAGKTTFMKKMVAEAYAGEKVVIVENEFGEIGIDAGFLKDGEVGYVIVGIGVNVHQTGFPEDIAAMATSLDLELDGRMASRQAVTESIWTNFLRLYREFMLTEDLSGILEEYNARLVNVGQEVRILDPLGEYTAISQGIDATGALLVKTGSGEIKRVDSGEVSVRGIYGYV